MSPRPETPGWLKPGLTLTGAAREFFRHPSPKVLVPAAVTAVAARAALGRWTRRDAAVAAGIVAGEPFVEWIVHVGVLHWRPRTVNGRRIDPLLSRKHRAHHRDPRDAELVFVPMPVATRVIAGIVGLNTAILRDRRLAMTGVATSLTALAAYEWTHFLIHSSYRPKHAPYRAAWRSHRLHHYRNERYWFGVVTPISDQALGTYPAKDDVPASPTAKTLGIEEIEEPLPA
ncbi:sterol desaturase family protein [Actinomadura harenae]|uniref:Fatty acid hydroxylase family protein n=1 Tax=Actinomadura harenae TaxID=2483351 RepID=A0A3M2M388_9ACTN|nr:sterol desaturase family protein [Actinomadura harenae]RMI44214.1 fatty acid hydroxylase family protein [Actinomadura harenae]